MDVKFYGACRNGDLEEVKNILKNNRININYHKKDDRNWTPLRVSCNYGRLEVVKFLVEKGADIEIKDLDGNTPLILASSNNRSQIFKFLVEFGNANIEVKNDEGITPLILHYCMII